MLDLHSCMACKFLQRLFSCDMSAEFEHVFSALLQVSAVIPLQGMDFVAHNLHCCELLRMCTPTMPYHAWVVFYRVVTVLGCPAGCDVLWGGCPMITLPLERMASRVAASLCYATGLGHEMVVNSQQASPSCGSLPSC